MKTDVHKGYWLRWQQALTQTLLDAALAQKYDWQRADLEQAIMHRFVRINNQVCTDIDQIAQAGDHISLWLAEHQEGVVDEHWSLLWRNHELLVVHKPAGLPVSRTTRNLFGTLISLVRRLGPYPDAHLLHRLDAETSGAMVLAQHSLADRKWKKKLEKLLVGKTYHALVYGAPSWEDLRAEHYLAERRNSAIRSQMHVVDVNDSDCVKTPKLAITEFRVLQRMGNVTLVECTLLTGRKHQIRAQLAYLGFPIVGDKTYAFSGQFYLSRLERDLILSEQQQLGAAHQLLHAYKLVLNTGKEEVVVIDDQYPNAWQAYLAKDYSPN